MLLKKIFNTILILIGIALMVVLAGFAIMMFAHVSLFGYTWLSLSQTESQLKFEFSADNLNAIDVKTTNLDVTIEYYDEPNTTAGYVEIVVNMQGIVKDDVKEVSFCEESVDENGTTKYTSINKESIAIDSNGVLKVQTLEPSGLFFKNNSKLKIVLPRKKSNNTSFSLGTLKINTSANNINVGNNKEFVINNLDVTASKKFLNASVSIDKNVTINNNLTLNTNYGRIKVDAKINGNLNVNSLAGSILINSNIGGNVDITGVNPLVEIGSMPGSWRNRKDDYSTMTNEIMENKNAKAVYGDVIIHDIENGGNVKVSGIIGGDTYINANDIEFWAGFILKGLYCDEGSNNIRVFGSLGVKLDELKSEYAMAMVLLLGATDEVKYCSLDIVDGSLFINNAYHTLNILAKKGDIYINRIQNGATIKSTNGGATVCESHGELNIECENHNIKVLDIYGTVNLTALRGTITADFKNVLGQNKIIAQRNINVKVKDGVAFNLTTKAKAGGVNVSMIPLEYNNWNGVEKQDGWYVRTDPVNGGSLANTLLLQMNGADKISAELYV